MVLMQWLERGLGQLLAPDKNYIPDPDKIDTSSYFWNLVAPDPNFVPNDKNETATETVATPLFSPSTPGTGTKSRRNKNNNIASSPMTTTTINENRNILMTPSPKYKRTNKNKLSTARKLNEMSNSNDGGGDDDDSSNPFNMSNQYPDYDDDDDEEDNVDNRVLFTAKSFANCMASPLVMRKKSDTLFRYCASTVLINPSIQKKLRNMIQKDLTVFELRCSKMGHACPDGYSLLMACAHANNVVAAEILWEYGPSDQLKETNLLGQTPYHIAAENGHVEILQFLQSKYGATYGLLSPPPVDLMGRTPLGVALMSPVPNAKKNSKQLNELLFSPKDVSIVGTPVPVQHRGTYNTKLQITYGVCQMPGQRVIMEDSCVASSSSLPPSTESLSSSKTTKNTIIDHHALFAVCDGHSDLGQVSKFVAESFPYKVQQLIKKYTSSSSSSNNTIISTPPPRTNVGKENIVSSETADDDPHVVTSKDESMMTMTMNWDGLCKELCLSIDERLFQMSIPGGSTAVLTIVTMNEIICANVGDCRCILIQTLESVSPKKAGKEMVEPTLESEDVITSPPTAVISAMDSPSTTKKSIWEQYKIIELSHDHKANNEIEINRIQNAGLQVIEEKFLDKDGVTEVTISKVVLSSKDMMACSRSFGDFEYKGNTAFDTSEQAVIAVPDVIVQPRSHELDCFLVLACDGIWDVMSNEDVGQFIIETLSQNSDDTNSVPSLSSPTPSASYTTAATILPQVGDALLMECLKRGSGDNLSCIIVALNHNNPKTQHLFRRPLTIDSMMFVQPQSHGQKALDFSK